MFFIPLGITTGFLSPDFLKEFLNFLILQISHLSLRDDLWHLSLYILSRFCLVCRDWDHLCVMCSRSRFPPHFICRWRQIQPVGFLAIYDGQCPKCWTQLRYTIIRVLWQWITLLLTVFPPHVASFLKLSHTFVISLSCQKEVEKVYNEMKHADTIRQY